MRSKYGLLKFGHTFFILIVGAVVSMARYVVHGIDDWADRVKHEGIKDNETYTPPRIVEPHPYGYDLMVEPKRFQGELTTNDIAVIFDDI